jgi:hypothetical protein
VTNNDGSANDDGGEEDIEAMQWSHLGFNESGS